MHVSHFFASQCWYKFFQLKLDFSQGFVSKKVLFTFSLPKCHEFFVKALLDDQFCRLREKEILSGGHFVCHAWSFRSNVVIACPFQKYFLGSMSKTSVDHTALDVPCNKFQKIVIGVFMLHFCHNFNFLISKNRVYTIAYQTLPFVEMEKWVKKPQK